METTNIISSKNLKYRFLELLTIILFVFGGFQTYNANENNVTITNVVCQNPGSANPQISFYLSWNNSWRTTSIAPYNYDAIWVFVKTQYVPNTAVNCETTNPWTHAKMNATTANDTVGYPLQFSLPLPTDRMGIFIQRSVDGTGNIQPTRVSLFLDQALGTPTPGSFNFKVFAIEMVYIPTGAFTLGDGTSTNYLTKAINSATDQPGTNGALTLQDCWDVASIPAAYPNGYSSFYAMKYEISQQQYVEFLNTLTYAQQASRTAIAPNTTATVAGTYAMYSQAGSVAAQNRNSIKLIQSGIAATSTPAVYGCDLALAPGDPFNSTVDGKNIAMNYMKYDDLLAYLDWAALRPMTNFEFEKVCRGSGVAAVGQESAVGVAVNVTAPTAANSGALSNAGQSSEVSTSTANASGLFAYNSIAANGPLRVGFAATSSTTRVGAGAGYYGAMDMSGNVWEMVVGGWDPRQSGYKITVANNGDGTLDASGNANTTNWQNGTYTGVIDNQWYSLCTAVNYWHFEFRGGAYDQAASTLRVSDRSYNGGNVCGYYCSCADPGHNSASYGYGNTATQSRLANAGGRGVRSYP
ncbi:MAG: hypothetical protein Q8880_06590 [Bacteroidota bacterium]|nr:hypothetical protein [Bacteroidota bacterium]